MEFTVDQTGFKWHMDSVGAWISILHPDREMVQEFIKTLDKPQDVVIKLHKEKKSNDANSYCWVLLGELSKVLGRSDKDIYKELIQDIGGNNYITPVRDDLLDNWIYLWESVPKTKIGWTSKILGKCKNHEGYSNTINYYGSSMYDTAQMSRLIDLVVQECQQQNPPIETRTPREIEELKRKWGEK